VLTILATVGSLKTAGRAPSGIEAYCAGRQQREQETVQAELYEQIGRLKMELEWLKKVTG